MKEIGNSYKLMGFFKRSNFINLNEKNYLNLFEIIYKSLREDLIDEFNNNNIMNKEI